MKSLQNVVYEVNTKTKVVRIIAKFLEPMDGLLFVDAMKGLGSDVYMIDYAGERYPEGD